MKRVPLLLIAFVCFSVYAKPSSESKKHREPESTESEFKIKKGLLETLYRESIHEVQVETRTGTGGAVEITPQFSMIDASIFELSNNYFTVPYTEGGGKMPLFQMLFTTPITYQYGVEVHGQARVGFSYQETQRSVVSKTGVPNLKDIVTLQWIPISLAIKLGYRIPRFSLLKPYLSFGGGAQWLSQEGKLDGITQGFWVPFYLVSAGATLFDQSEKGDHWFGGLNLGATLSRSAGSTQNIRYWSMDAGFTIVL